MFIFNVPFVSGRNVGERRGYIHADLGQLLLAGVSGSWYMRIFIRRFWRLEGTFFLCAHRCGQANRILRNRAIMLAR
jgi:hypothetical protein